METSVRLASAAARGQVLVTRTIVDLVPGSGLEFTSTQPDASAYVLTSAAASSGATDGPLLLLPPESRRTGKPLLQAYD